MSYTREQIEATLKSEGHTYFEDKANKGYDVNIVGVRNSLTGTSVTNLFDDIMTLSYKDNGKWIYKEWPITTDPGNKAMKEYHNPKGVARLAPGQYRGSHCIGLHKGQYEALTQKNAVTIWRDNNKNLLHDMQIIDKGLFGINIHRSNPKTESTYVENWSEGCQVFKRAKDFKEFMDILHKAKDIHGNSFTYTLIESKDIIL